MREVANEQHRHHQREIDVCLQGLVLGKQVVLERSLGAEAQETADGGATEHLLECRAVCIVRARRKLVIHPAAVTVMVRKASERINVLVALRGKTKDTDLQWRAGI